MEETALQDTASRDRSVAGSRRTTPEGEDRDDAGGASTGTPLWEELQGCEKSQEECVRDFVARVAPEAQYVGGRTDANDFGRNRHVLYFVDPARAPCEYEKFESPADAPDVSYEVLIAGEGSFAPNRQEDSGRGCLPEL